MRKLFWFAVAWIALILCIYLFLWGRNYCDFATLAVTFRSDLSNAWSYFDIRAVLSHLSALATFILLCAALLIHGKMLSKWLRLDFPSGCTRVVHPLALGLLLLFVLFTFLGAVHLYKPAIAWAFVAVAAASACYFTITQFGYLREEFRIAVPAEGWNRALLLGILLLLGYLLLAVYRPPAQWDELAYNLFFPKKYIAHNGLLLFDELGSYSCFPAYADMSFVAGLLLGWEHVIPHLFGWLFTLMLALSLASVAKHFDLERRYTPLLVFSLLSATTIIEWAPACKPDTITAACELLALDALLRWADTRRMRFFALSAVYAGASLGLKYNALLTLPVLLLAALYLLRARAASFKSMCGHVLLYCAIVAVLFSPWVIRNMLMTGNPLFPFATSLFGGPLTPEQAAMWNELSHETKNKSLNRYLNFAAVANRLIFKEMGPWLAMFLPPYLALLWFGRLNKYRRQELLLLLVEAACLVSFSFFPLILRYNYLPYGLLLIACALAIQCLCRLHVRFGYLLAAVTALVFILTCATIRRCHPDVFELCVKLPSKDESILRWCPQGDFIYWMNHNLPANARVIMTGTPLYYAFYYAERHLEGLDPKTDADDFSRQLQALSITHIAYCRPNLEITGIWFVPGGGRASIAFAKRTDQIVNELARRGRIALICTMPPVEFYEVRNSSTPDMAAPGP